MSDHAKHWTDQFIDEDGEPYGLCFAQFFDVTGSSRKAVWTDRDKTLPSAGGTTLDIDGDAAGRIEAYGDGVYQIIVRQSGDDGSGTPIAVFEGVQLVDAEEAYDGATTGYTLEEEEENRLSRRGRQAAASGGATQSGTTLNLSLFDAAGGTYLVAGTASLLTFQFISLEDYEDGAEIILECVTNPIKLRAQRDGESSATYNVDIGSDFYMPVGSRIALELRDSVWRQSWRYFADSPYDDLENTGVASASPLIIPRANVVKVTGSTGFTNVWWGQTGEYAPPGTKLDLYFSGSLTVTDGGNLALDGDFATANGSVLGLVSIGTGWVERFRRQATTARIATIADSATPNVTGPYDILQTGNNLTTITNMTGGVLGQLVTVENNCTVADNSPYYTNRRRILTHATSGTEGYINLATGANFGMLDGDTITLRCMRDASSVLYWREVSRFEIHTNIPQLDVAAAPTITIWRSRHAIKNTSGGSLTITDVLPAYNPGHIISLIKVDPDNDVVLTETGGNLLMGATATLSDPGKEIILRSTKMLEGAANIARKWIQLDSGTT